MVKSIIFFLSIFLTQIQYSYALQITKGVWIDPQTPIINKEVKIFIPLFNPNQNTIKGEVSITYGDLFSEKKELLIEGKDITLVSFSFIAKKEDDLVEINISNLYLCKDENCEQKKELLSGEKTLDTFLIKASIDTDSDGITDEVDPDDDNDGLSDVFEQIILSDPKKNDTDNDGIKDSEEKIEETLLKNKEKTPLENKLEKNPLFKRYKTTIESFAVKYVKRLSETEDSTIQNIFEKTKNKTQEIEKNNPFPFISLPQTAFVKNLSWQNIKVFLLRNVLSLLLNTYFLLFLPIFLFFLLLVLIVKK